ncbi:Ca2+-binding RTX toxin-like protein [Rhizobium sp. BK529]|nr:Ca2+-binding RTX toxin-like protein [Rhizobium sp. BK529]
MKFVFVSGRDDTPDIVVQRLHAFLDAHPGSIVGIEGPNEVNNWPVSYNGLSGEAAALAYQKDLFNAVNADPLLKNIPVLGFTGYTVASSNDYTTIHTYAKDGDQPFTWLQRESGEQMNADTGKPFTITETGYHTSLTADTNGGWEGVDETTQAKLLLNTLMDGAFLGSKGTFIYQLLDAYSDPQGSDQEKHFGLFRLDYSPKPAATAIHNLTEILADDGATQATFAPGALNYSISGLPSTARSYLTEKSDGSYQIIIWNEPDIWNQTTDKAIQVAAASINVNLGATFGTVQVHDPLKGDTLIKSFSNISSLNVDVIDHPIIINVSGGGGAPQEPGHIYGGTGDDVFTITSPTEIVDESRGGGTDTVISSISFNLANTLGTVENLTLSGSAQLNATGNDADNILTGNSGANIIYGGLGNDRLIGGGGIDTLNGGVGADYFIFNTKPSKTSNVDKIEDFSAASGDKIVLDHNVFTAIDPASFSSANFVVGIKAMDANDRLIYNRSSGSLLYDADGNGSGAAVQIATLTNLAMLHHDDFLFL